MVASGAVLKKAGAPASKSYAQLGLILPVPDLLEQIHHVWHTAIVAETYALPKYNVHRKQVLSLTPSDNF